MSDGGGEEQAPENVRPLEPSGSYTFNRNYYHQEANLSKMSSRQAWRDLDVMGQFLRESKEEGAS